MGREPNPDRAQRRTVLLGYLLAGYPTTDAARHAGYGDEYVRCRSDKLWKTASREMYKWIAAGFVREVGEALNALDHSGFHGLCASSSLLKGERVSPYVRLRK